MIAWHPKARRPTLRYRSVPSRQGEKSSAVVRLLPYSCGRRRILFGGEPSEHVVWNVGLDDARCGRGAVRFRASAEAMSCDVRS